MHRDHTPLRPKLGGRTRARPPDQMRSQARRAPERADLHRLTQDRPPRVGRRTSRVAQAELVVPTTPATGLGDAGVQPFDRRALLRARARRAWSAPMRPRRTVRHAAGARSGSNRSSPTPGAPRARRPSARRRARTSTSTVRGPPSASPKMASRSTTPSVVHRSARAARPCPPRLAASARTVTG